MKVQTDWDLLLRYLSEETSAEESEKIKVWLAANPENERLMTSLIELWKEPVQDMTPADFEAAWTKLSHKAAISIPLDRQEGLPKKKIPGRKTNRHQRSKVYHLLRVAAIAVIALPLYYLLSNYESPISFVSPSSEKVLVKYGRQTVLSLADGTSIKLDAGSELIYPKEFSADSREVEFRGEGYFDIAPDPKKPFIIHSSGAEIKVLGTEFNISSWPDRKRVEVAVSKGLVSFRSEDRGLQEGVIISAGRMSRLLENGIPTQPVRADLSSHTGWLNRELILKNASLNEALDQLTRWYDLHIKLPDDVYKSVKITGTFKKKSVDQMLEAIALMINLSVERKGKAVVFHPKNKPTNTN
jgi:transmembrane sensor